MYIPIQWLRDYVAFEGPVADLAHRVTLAGLEVAGVERRGDDISGVVVARIVEKGPHPNADRLSLCRVTDGEETLDIVCGATNMAVGDTVALARVGARLPGGFKIKKSKIRGQVSFGMMCSMRELGLSEEHEGILILPPDAPLGTPLVEYLGLPEEVIDVEITPNRGDCLSVLGVAREVAALTGAPLRIPVPVFQEEGPAIADGTSVTIEDPDLCHRYAARIVRGITLGPSPLWLKRRLAACGVRAINNVVDVTNYVLLELGHPLHAFDLKRLAEERIVVRRAGPGTTFTTLDDQERLLDEESLMICDGDKPVALAGIMGGLNSEVEDDTVDLLIESAWFAPANIRSTSKRLGLSTEASYRFERGTDIVGLRLALDRAVELIVRLAGGTVDRGVCDAYPTPHEPTRIALRADKVSDVLGCDISADESKRCLEALGMSAEGEGGVLQVVVPFHRVDVEREIDLIEEVARIRGYDRIPATLPRVAMTGDPEPTASTVADRTRDALVAAGLREAVTYSFTDPAEDDRLGLPGDDPCRAKVALANPLGRETSVLRTSLLPALLRAVGRNLRRQARDVRLFEVGRTFHPVADRGLPREVNRVTGVITGRRAPLAWWGEAAPLDFFDARGVVESLLSAHGLESPRFEPLTDCPWLHPGRAARVGEGDAELGWVGQVHPERLDGFGLDEPAFAFDLDLDALARCRESAGTFPGLGRYPAVERDMAIIVDRKVAAGRILAEFTELGDPLVQGAVLFDVFEGGRIPAGKVSLAFRVTYRSDDRTLTEEEVGQVEARLLERLTQQVGARLRDV